MHRLVLELLLLELLLLLLLPLQQRKWRRLRGLQRGATAPRRGVSIWKLHRGSGSAER